MKDKITSIITYTFSSFGFLILATLFIFIFQKGYQSLNFQMIFGDYESLNLKTSMDNSLDYHLGGFLDSKKEDLYFSSEWGIGLSERLNRNKEWVVYIAYLDESSPLCSMNDSTKEGYVQLKVGYEISKVSGITSGDEYLVSFSKYGAQKVASNLDEMVKISQMNLSYQGGGIRGSLITTLLMIVFTLLFSLPLGIGVAIYLHEYAKNNRLTRIIRTLIDLSSGIPSIIFGLVGAMIFIPFMNKAIGSKGGSILSGALTLSVMLLPIIIKTTEEALAVIPQSYRNASLALGASKSETVFKVVLPNALSGIITATILCCGRIISESAALIYAVGTTIKDNVALNQRSTTLAVHIWSLMGLENPNYEQASAISIIILLTVLVLSIGVEIIGKKLNRFEVKN